MSRRDPAGESWSIRQCRLSDLDQVTEVEEASFPDPYDRFTFVQLLELEPGGFLVAERDRRLLGYITGVVRGDEAMIYSIAVIADSRRRGVAGALMKGELDYLSGKAGRVYLQVSVNNPAAISLYKRFSFVELGRVRKYYRNGDDALIMSRDLHASVEVGGAGEST